MIITIRRTVFLRFSYDYSENENRSLGIMVLLLSIGKSCGILPAAVVTYCVSRSFRRLQR